LLNKFKEIEEAQLSAGQAGAQSVASVFAQTGAYTSGATKEEIQQAQKILQGSPGAFTETERANIFKSVQDQSKGALSVLQAATLTGKISSQYGPVVGGNAQAAQDLGSDIGALMSTGLFTQEEAKGRGLMLNQAKGAQGGLVTGSLPAINTIMGGAQLGDEGNAKLRDQLLTLSQIAGQAGLPAESINTYAMGQLNRKKQEYAQSGIDYGMTPQEAKAAAEARFSRPGAVAEVISGAIGPIFSGNEQEKQAAVSAMARTGEGGMKLGGALGGKSAAELAEMNRAMTNADFAKQTSEMQDRMPEQSRLESARAVSEAAKSREDAARANDEMRLKQVNQRIDEELSRFSEGEQAILRTRQTFDSIAQGLTPNRSEFAIRTLATYTGMSPEQQLQAEFGDDPGARSQFGFTSPNNYNPLTGVMTEPENYPMPQGPIRRPENMAGQAPRQYEGQQQPQSVNINVNVRGPVDADVEVMSTQ
jgi:hypothetical protein